MKGLRPVFSITLLLISLNASPASVDLKEVNNCSNNSEYKSMDSNKDGQISKSEFMRFQEQYFDKVKQKGSMVIMEELDEVTNHTSINHMAIEAASGSTDVKGRGDAVNRSKY